MNQLAPPPSKRLSWFAFYYQDFITDPIVQAMTDEELGIYIRLICYAASSDPPGTLVNDDQLFARILKKRISKWKILKPRVMGAFQLNPDGVFVQKRLAKECQISKIASEHGRKAATNRWNQQHARAYAQSDSSICPTDANRVRVREEKEQKTEEAKATCFASTASASPKSVPPHEGLEVGDKPRSARTPQTSTATTATGPTKAEVVAATGPTKAEVVAIVGVFQKRWIDSRCPEDGKPPKVSAADFIQAKAVLRRLGSEATLAIFDRYLADPDPYLVKQGHPLKLLASRVDAYRQTVTPKQQREWQGKPIGVGGVTSYDKTHEVKL